MDLSVTDGNRSLYALYYEAVWGQGGLHIDTLFGFFGTDEAAKDAMNIQEGVLIFGSDYYLCSIIKC